MGEPIKRSGASKPLVLRAADIAARAETFSHPWNPASCITGTMLGRATGLRHAGVSLARVLPRKEFFACHAHHVEEKCVYILSGTETVEINGTEHVLRPGDFAGFPPSTAHHLRNTGAEDVVNVMGGENREAEIADFPRLGRRKIKRGDMVEVVYLSDVRPFDTSGARSGGYPSAASMSFSRSSGVVVGA